MMRQTRREALATAVAAALLPASQARSQAVHFFGIGTGGIAGTYYPVGGLLADVISRPPGGRACEEGGSCGVEGLVGVAMTSRGSVENVEEIARGGIESGLAQSDIAFSAFSGTGVFEKRAPLESLRLIASLYLESVHLVIAPESEIASLPDLEGKRLSIDDPGSGTQRDAKLILAAVGLDETDFEASYLDPLEAVRWMREGKLDAFFAVAGWPTASVSELTSDIGAGLLPIEGPEIDALIGHYPFFTHDLIPAGTYAGIDDVPTLGVVAQWLTSSAQDEALIYDVTRALWHPNARVLLDSGHTKAKSITLETALEGAAIPIHPGAARYYREVGLLP